MPIRDEITIQVPIAYVIWKKGCGSAEDLEQLKTYVEENLEGCYRPVKYISVGSFPLTRIGKVDYITLGKMAEKAD